MLHLTVWNEVQVKSQKPREAYILSDYHECYRKIILKEIRITILNRIYFLHFKILYHSAVKKKKLGSYFYLYGNKGKI